MTTLSYKVRIQLVNKNLGHTRQFELSTLNFHRLLTLLFHWLMLRFVFAAVTFHWIIFTIEPAAHLAVQ